MSLVRVTMAVKPSSKPENFMQAFLIPLFALLMCGLALPTAIAQTDARPLRLVIPFTPGGAQDVIGRYLGDRLAKLRGIAVVVENKAGAGGELAADAVSKATADGSVLLLATGGAISIAPVLNAKLPYDPKRDLVPVAMIADTPMTIAVRADSPYKNLGDVLRDAKSKPGQIGFASTGNATLSHLTGELLAQAAGVKLLHVPYRGAAPAITDLIGGQVPLIVTSVASINPMAEAGKVRVLGTFTKSRLPNLGSPPTVAEATGLAGMDIPIWVGVMAPATTPADRIDRLSTEIGAVCKMPETQAYFASLGAISDCAGHAAFARMLADDSSRWTQVIQKGGVKID